LIVLFEYLAITGGWIPVPAEATQLQGKLWKVELQFDADVPVHDSFFDGTRTRINGVEVRQVLNTRVIRDPASSNPLIVLLDVLK